MDAIVGTEEDESPRKVLLRRGGGGAGAVDDRLGGLEANWMGSAAPSSEIGIERPEFTLAIDIGLVLLDGGGAGTGFFCGFELAFVSFDSIFRSGRFLISSGSEYFIEDAKGSAGSALLLSLGELGDNEISVFPDIDVVATERGKANEGPSKDAVCGRLLCIGLPWRCIGVVGFGFDVWGSTASEDCCRKSFEIEDSRDVWGDSWGMLEACSNKDCRDADDVSVLLLLSPFCIWLKLTGGAVVVGLGLDPFFSPVRRSFLKSSTSYCGLVGVSLALDGFTSVTD